MIGTELLLLFM